MAKKKKGQDQDPDLVMETPPDNLPQTGQVDPYPQGMTAPAPMLDYPMPEQNGLGDQVTAAWNQLLALATSQGASRRDIVLMTLATAHGIIKITGEALWPRDTDLPPDEIQGFGIYQTAYHATGQALAALTPESDDGAQVAGE